VSDTSTDLQPDPADAPLEQAARAIATAEDFAAVDFQYAIAALASCDPHDLESIFQQQTANAQAAGNAVAERVFALLTAICSIALRPGDRGGAWGPRFIFGASRSTTSTDLAGEQNDVLRGLLGGISHLGLRSRLADLVWSNDRKAGDAARIAIDAYCDWADGLVSGAITPWLASADHALFEAVPLIKRSLQIVHRTTKKTKRPPTVAQAFQRLYTACKHRRAYHAFREISEIGLYFELIDATSVAGDCEALVAEVVDPKVAMVIKPLWEKAAQLHHSLGDEPARQRCLIGAFEQTLLMREQVRGSAGAEASWVTDALQQLRHIDGMEAREVELEGELKSLQRQSLKEMAPISVKMDIEEDVQATIGAFEALDLAEALRQFALLATSPSVEELRRIAKDQAEASPLSSIFGSVHLDDRGRPVAKTPGTSADGSGGDESYLRLISQYEGIRRQQLVASRVHPARLVINAKFEPDERHFGILVSYSPIIDEHQKPLVALGLTRFFQGDMMSAAHLLIPQVEPCIREALRINGHDPAKRRDDDTEEDYALGGLFLNFRAEIDGIFSPQIAAEIDRLFNATPGPRLRHELAHGQLSAGSCFHSDVYYASWFIYRIVSLFTLRGWDTAVAPHLMTLN
jgi:hypothetical protein